MIIIRTPLRISFFGGGTDIRNYYESDYGLVVGTTINKFVNVIINKRFEESIKISYKENEIVNNVKEIKHKIIRTALQEFKIKKGIEIVTIADIPGTGTGLGSSSSLTVGLCHGLSILDGKKPSKKWIAEKACDIEINKVKSPIGKQDQYFASYGGLNSIKFQENEKVRIEKINLNKPTLDELDNNILAFYTGISHNTNKILGKQSEKIEKNIIILNDLRNLAEDGKSALKENDLTKFALLLNKSWELKKEMSFRVTNKTIDLAYKKAIKSGALGGKIAGSGGGGFLVLYCEPKFQENVKRSLKGLKELDVNLDFKGTINIEN